MRESHRHVLGVHDNAYLSCFDLFAGFDLLGRHNHAQFGSQRTSSVDSGLCPSEYFSVGLHKKESIVPAVMVVGPGRCNPGEHVELSVRLFVHLTKLKAWV